MPDWRSRLAVSYHDEDGNDVNVTPIDAFSPSFSRNAGTLQSIMFSMTVRAVGDAVARLTTLALQGKRFDITLQETDDGVDWSSDSVVLSDCVITNANPSPATISGAPAATFSGLSLSSTVDPA